jgi:lipopolysaccharide export system ATP-binding protein
LTDILTVDSVSKSFRRRCVLSSATLRASPGQVRVILGRNGSGKSTLFRIAAGWLAPDAGNIRFDGEVRLRASFAASAARGLFFLPDRDLISNAFSVETQLEMFAQRFSRPDWRETAKLMEIDTVLHWRPRALASGRLRRAELAAAIIRQPRVLLADEPYRGIEPIDRELLSRTFRSLAARGCAVVISGHEVAALLDVADHVTWWYLRDDARARRTGQRR